MSIQNMLTAALFKSDEAGRIIMYPNGATGRGYFVPDEATRQRMRRTLMWLVIGAGLTGGIGVQVMMLFYGQVFDWTGEPWAIALAALVAFGVGYRMIVARLTRGLEPASQRMGMVEALRRQAEAMPRWYLCFIAVLSPLMVAGSVVWMARGFASLPSVLVGLVSARCCSAW